MNITIFYKIYRELQRAIAPQLKYSQTIYEDILTEYSKESIRWLDLGCGHQLLPPWRFRQEQILASRAKMIVGVDYDYSSLVNHKSINKKLRCNISQLPFANDSFDLITSNMVFEHLEDPEHQLKEIFRVLSVGGKLIFHTPNILGYSTIFARIIPEPLKAKIVYLLQGRKEEDVYPAFYRINSFRKIVELTKHSGFTLSKIYMICSSAQFAILPPIVVFELIFIRLLLSRAGRSFRTNIIAILGKS